MSLKARLEKLERDREADAVPCCPLYFPPLCVDPGVQSDMDVAVKRNPDITDAELRAMARRPLPAVWWEVPHPDSVEDAVRSARETAAFWAREAEREEIQRAAGA